MTKQVITLSDRAAERVKQIMSQAKDKMSEAAKLELNL